MVVQHGAATLLALLLLLPPLPTAAVGGARALQQQQRDELDAFIEDKMAAVHIPSLSALVQRNSTLLWSRAFGYADAFSDPPRNASVTATPYTMASVSKTVMATTLMTLFDRGLFALDDDINAVLNSSARAGFELRNPSFPLAPITFRQLLTHTSSVNDDCWAEASDALFYTRGKNNPWAVRDMLYAYLSPAGRFYNATKCFHPRAPGEMYDYSNIGANVLGFLVEVLAGSSSFGRYSVANVLEPLVSRSIALLLLHRLNGLPRQTHGSQQWTLSLKGRLRFL
jgi:CubicO group peptidase (beta-lactamase class C family)